MTEALFQGLLKTGAPWGLLCAALLVAVCVLYRRNVSLSDRLFDLSAAGIRRDVEVHHALEEARREMEELRRCLQ